MKAEEIKIKEVKETKEAKEVKETPKKPMTRPAEKENLENFVVRSGEYSVFAISTDNAESVAETAHFLEPLGVKMTPMVDGNIHRLRFGSPTTSREVAMRRITLLQKAGVKTAHHLLS